MALNGGKHDLAKWILSLMPPRCKNPNKPAPDDPGWLHYVEGYAGGLSVLLALDPEGISEVVNDKNGTLIDFWQVMRNENLFEKFLRAVQAMPFSSELYETAMAFLPTPHMTTNWDRAAYFFVACRQSLAGRMKDFALLTRNRTRRGMNEQASAWLNAIEGLPAVHARLKRVVVLCGDALDVIRKQDGLRTLFYLDPPYLHETRATTKEYGDYEMSYEQHAELLSLLRTIQGRFLLSGYRSDLYDSYALANHWDRQEVEINNHAAGGKTKRVMTECIWRNFTT